MRKTRSFPLMAAIAMIVLGILACSGSFSTANITDAYMAADSDGTQRTTTFSGDQIFYCIVQVANAPEDTTLKAVWTAVAVEGEDPNLELNTTDATVGTLDTFAFHLSNDSLWPPGQYKVDIYLNDTLDRTLEFSVQ